MMEYLKIKEYRKDNAKHYKIKEEVYQHKKYNKDK
jgi:hypothetical protein